jgi:uncharacterized protein YggT (Ycf19 family)
VNIGVYLVLQSALLFVDVIDIAMLARMLMSFIMMGEQNGITTFLYVITEPVIMPVRALCNRLGLFRGLPFDMPFFITSVFLMVVSIALQAWLSL